jgi:pimeloyl-ACP methyl ester carboxylesterase
MSLSSVSRLGLAVTVLLTGLSCSDEVPPAAVPGTPTETLAFAPCDITTTLGTFPLAAECASLEVPARREVAASQSVLLSLKRYTQVAQPRGQLWLIAGGPGSAASDMEYDAEMYLALGRDLELYFLDHRGAGRSDRLTCPTEEAPTGPSGNLIREAEWASCAAVLKEHWGEDLAGFSVTEAAKDLGESIEHTREDGLPVYLYAVSYGTYLAQRYLQLYPSQPSGIILDSICSPGKCDLLLEFDRQFDATAQAIFAYCAADADCALELGTDPWSRVKSLSASLASGHCPEIGWSQATLRQVLGLMTSIAGLRDYMPAVVRRLERCSANDVAALGVFREFVSAIDTEASSFSQALSTHILLSELSTRPLPTASQVVENVAGLFASIDAGPRVAPAISNWPIYGRDAYFGVFAATAVPLLMLNGTLDPQTPLAVAQPLGEFYRGKNQHFVSIPYSPHNTLTQSLVDQAGNTCGAELASQFLVDPATALDTSCLSAVLPLNFAGVPTITRRLFGTDSPWADSTTVTSSP